MGDLLRFRRGKKFAEPTITISFPPGLHEALEAMVSETVRAMEILRESGHNEAADELEVAIRDAVAAVIEAAMGVE